MGMGLRRSRGHAVGLVSTRYVCYVWWAVVKGIIETYNVVDMLDYISRRNLGVFLQQVAHLRVDLLEIRVVPLLVPRGVAVVGGSHDQ